MWIKKCLYHSWRTFHMHSVAVELFWYFVTLVIGKKLQDTCTCSLFLCVTVHWMIWCTCACSLFLCNSALNGSVQNTFRLWRFLVHFNAQHLCVEGDAPCLMLSESQCVWSDERKTCYTVLDVRAHHRQLELNTPGINMGMFSWTTNSRRRELTWVDC